MQDMAEDRTPFWVGHRLQNLHPSEHPQCQKSEETFFDDHHRLYYAQILDVARRNYSHITAIDLAVRCHGMFLPISHFLTTLYQRSMRPVYSTPIDASIVKRSTVSDSSCCQHVDILWEAYILVLMGQNHNTG